MTEKDLHQQLWTILRDASITAGKKTNVKQAFADLTAGINKSLQLLAGSYPDPDAQQAADISALQLAQANVEADVADLDARVTDLEGGVVAPPDPPDPPPTGTGEIVLLGDVVNGPYQIESKPPADIDALVYSVEWGKDGSYWASTNKRPFYFWRTQGGDIGPPIPWAPLGTGYHRITADYRQIVNGNPAPIGTPAQLTYWEGPGAPPPDPTPAPPPALFPVTAVWNTPIDTAPLHPDSHNLADNVNWRGGHPLHPDFGTIYNGRLNGIPVNVVAGSVTPKKMVAIGAYAAESDPMPAGGVPIPDDVRIENDPAPGTTLPYDPSADHHCIIVDTDTHTLHEFYQLERLAGGAYRAAWYGRWDYQSNALRTDGWTSGDAAGLPVGPLLVNYDEVAAAVQNNSVVPHAFRFTIEFSYAGPSPTYLWPARHSTNTGDNTRPKFGMRFRLKASFDDSGLSPTNRAICRTLKRYGMFFADNGGDYFLSGSPDSRWNDTDLHILQDKILPSRDLEVVDESAWLVGPNSAEARPV